MIPDHEQGGFRPGTPAPNHLARPLDFTRYPDLQPYLEHHAWDRGVGVVIIGPPKCGKTTLAMSILKAIYPDIPRMHYWTESDLVADLRTLWRYEDSSNKLIHDPALWTEYTEWERLFWERKSSPYLCIDDMCRSYTAMQWYEVEGLLRYREVSQLPTMLTVTPGRFDEAVPEMQGVMMGSGLVITMSPWEEP